MGHNICPYCSPPFEPQISFDVVKINNFLAVASAVLRVFSVSYKTIK